VTDIQIKLGLVLKTNICVAFNLQIGAKEQQSPGESKHLIDVELNQ
jgi:hypothetical protein